MARALFIANLSLLVLFPIAWLAPLLRAGLLPLFGMREISVVSGLAALWQTDIALALVVGVLALVVPYAKIIALALVQAGRWPARLLPLLGWLGKLAMAEVFLIALYIVVVKGAGVARVQPAWGLYLLTGCIFAALLIAGLSKDLPLAQKRPKR